MKQSTLICLAAVLTLSLSACGASAAEPAETPAPTETPQALEIPAAPREYDAPVVEDGGAVDIDLTQMSSTLVYSQVYDMINNPKEFVGKTVRMEGPTVSATEGDVTYHALVIEDAGGCCSLQGIEYQLCGDESYPQNDERATVTGEFGIYRENNNTYIVLNGARLEN